MVFTEIDCALSEIFEDSYLSNVFVTYKSFAKLISSKNLGFFYNFGSFKSFRRKETFANFFLIFLLFRNILLTIVNIFPKFVYMREKTKQLFSQNLSLGFTSHSNCVLVLNPAAVQIPMFLFMRL